ncbi:MAG: glycosyltransferase family 39 protein [Elusimicrobiota bacterium]|nr:glycosyltransferase family 39 protein [Elusimicrobiota bacterium]
MKNILSEEKYFLPALFSAALALRLAYVLRSGQQNLSPDAYVWMETAWSIASGNGFGGSWRPPGFAFFLAGIFSLTGKSVLAVQLTQCLLGSFTVVFTAVTAKRIFGRATGLLSGALVCFYPYLLAYTRDPISETFLTFMLSAAILRIVIAAQRPSARNYAFAGVLMGLTGLTKSTTLPFFLLACGWLWWQTGKFRSGLIAGLFVLLSIAPWTFRNSIFYGGSYVMPVSTPWQSFYGASCDEALWQETAGAFDRPMDSKMTEPAIPKDWEQLRSLPVPERDRLCREKALAWIKANPDKFYYLLHRRFMHFWRLYPMMAYKWQKYAAMATSGLYIPLAAVGFFLSYRRFKDTSLFAALFASYTLVHIFFVTTLRYRVPLDPYLIILAASAIVAGIERLKPANGH